METQLVRPQLSSSGPSIIPTMLHRGEATQVVIIVKNVTESDMSRCLWKILIRKMCQGRNCCNFMTGHRLIAAPTCENVFSVESLCAAQKTQCSPERSTCSDGSGTARCQCFQGYYKHNQDDQSCLGGCSRALWHTRCADFYRFTQQAGVLMISDKKKITKKKSIVHTVMNDTLTKVVVHFLSVWLWFFFLKLMFSTCLLIILLCFVFCFPQNVEMVINWKTTHVFRKLYLKTMISLLFC